MRRSTALFAASVLATIAVTYAFAGVKPAGAPEPATTAQIIHALNRLTWGVEPGDVEVVRKAGLRQWIALQLRPESITENPELSEMLQPLDTLRMTPEEIIAHYPPQQVIQAMAEGRRAFPSDPKLQPVVEAEVIQYRSRLENKDAGSDKLTQVQQTLAELPVSSHSAALVDLLSADQLQSFRSAGAQQKVAILEGLPEATRDQVLLSLPRKVAQQIAPWLPAGQQHQLAYYLTPQQVVNEDLLDAKILRAVYSNRQLEDVLTDFWFNHFNIFINKGEDHFLITAYERDAIRPHVLGKFQDLLLATAQSPAMLFYLDNWQSVDPQTDAKQAAVRQAAIARQAQLAALRGVPFTPPAAPAQKRGLNENYGREVMELHTLGVNGGYTQKDVTEVARCFTGWTIAEPLQKAEFQYNDKLHDHGAKVVLGVDIAAGGDESDGLKVIQILARSPATAHHISYELAQRFVADEPPPALVDLMSATFLKSDGDLRQVMEAMIDSPEFWDPAYTRNKVKSPLEMVVSAVRGLGADVSNPTRLTQVIAQMGEPLYAKEPPTGYENTGETWVSSSGLVARLNFSLQLAANQVPGVQVDLTPFATGETTLATVEGNLFQGLLAGPPAAGTRATIDRMLAQMPTAQRATSMTDANPEPVAPAQLQRIAGLVLGSPDFQRR